MALVDCYDFVILKCSETKGERGPSRQAQRCRLAAVARDLGLDYLAPDQAIAA